MKVWITKYALTSGIIETEADVCDVGNGNMIETAKRGFFHKPDWHATREEADFRVSLMIDNRIASLENQIRKLRELIEQKGTQ